MFNKNLKLMTLSDTEEWFLNFINRKLKYNKDGEGVLILALYNIRKELKNAGYNKNLIDDNIINKVLNTNNFIYKKLNNIYIVVDCLRSSFPDKTLHRAVENKINEDYNSAKILKNLGVFLIIYASIFLISRILKEGFSFSRISIPALCFFCQGIVYVRLSKAEVNDLLKIKDSLSF